MAAWYDRLDEMADSAAGSTVWVQRPWRAAWRRAAPRRAAPHLTPALLRAVRDFWFEHLAGPDSLVLPTSSDSERWFFGGDELDRVCAERFAPTLEALRGCGVRSAGDILDAVQPADARDWLSLELLLVLLLDQMPRNCYRGAAARVAFTMRWQFACRTWFYMPLMHAEDVAAHETAVAEDERTRRDVYALAGGGAGAGADEKLVDVHVGFETRHFDIIRRFGRYPHRNKAMGREATPEEAACLAAGGETFAP
ncbi:hypothetical protein TOPH_08352 [Tolypocladium ophioglossoides CBS 100239]|uniref:DUF924-domain-containing protein n=1 Tax=Tolypocladium ophioglossoides (strain CBS 100239) TaxID=1163406 RepID=A0A0L0MZ16_TOLOC|nr:hypothetical protein TOPH_08352 [Tolypocladium ophioglossoides CBS 100239]